MEKDRLTLMAEYIIRKGEVTIDELAEIFNVSIVTVRRDLNKLEQRHLIEKVYGGAISVTNELQTFDQRSNFYDSEKKEICKSASKYIKNGDSIFIDSGTTVRYLLDFIDKSINLTLLTNNLYIINEARKLTNVDMYIVGNFYSRVSNSFIYRTGEIDLTQINIDKAFMGTSGLTIKNGLTNKNPLEQQIKREICYKSDNVYLLIDDSKFNKSSLMTFAELKDIDTIFTNKVPPKEYQNFFNKNNINCLYKENV